MYIEQVVDAKFVIPHLDEPRAEGVANETLEQLSTFPPTAHFRTHTRTHARTHIRTQHSAAHT